MALEANRSYGIVHGIIPECASKGSVEGDGIHIARADWEARFKTEGSGFRSCEREACQVSGISGGARTDMF